jgi:hypothetical protein
MRTQSVNSKLWRFLANEYSLPADYFSLNELSKIFINIKMLVDDDPSYQVMWLFPRGVDIFSLHRSYMLFQCGKLFVVE